MEKQEREVTSIPGSSRRDFLRTTGLAIGTAAYAAGSDVVVHAAIF